MGVPQSLSGSFSLAADGLRRLLAESPTWQAELRVATAAAASDSIYFRNAVGSARRPLAVISPGARHAWRLVAGGAQNYLRPEGQVALYMARDTADPWLDDLLEAEFDATNFFGSVIDDIAGAAGSDDRLPVVQIELATIEETPEEEWQSVGRFWFCVYLFDWGDGG